MSINAFLLLFNCRGHRLNIGAVFVVVYNFVYRTELYTIVVFFLVRCVQRLESSWLLVHWEFSFLFKSGLQVVLKDCCVGIFGGKSLVNAFWRSFFYKNSSVHNFLFFCLALHRIYFRRGCVEFFAKVLVLHWHTWFVWATCNSSQPLYFNADKARVGSAVDYILTGEVLLPRRFRRVLQVKPLSFIFYR